MSVLVRDATTDDLAAISALYNALIPTTTVAWTEQVETIDERRAWFAARSADGHPVLVADDGGAVVGYTAYESFRGEGKWPGYRHTAELSIHVADSHRGSGVGRALLHELIDRAVAAEVHVMVAAIDGDNDASIRFHEQLGFDVVARMPEVGRKFDRWLDLVLMQRIIGSPTR